MRPTFAETRGPELSGGGGGGGGGHLVAVYQVPERISGQCYSGVTVVLQCASRRSIASSRAWPLLLRLLAGGGGDGRAQIE